MDDEQWAAFFTVAVAKKGMAVPSPGVHGILGRSIAKAVRVVCFLWGRYQATLIPVLTASAIAALDALVANLGAIEAINPPGPQ